MKLNRNTSRTFTCFAILITVTLSGCNATLPDKTDSGTPLSGQKPIQGKPPAALNLSPEKARNAFGYDFNRDGVADWVVVASQQYNDDWYNYAVAVHLSQPGGTYQDVSPSTFDPGDHGNGMEPWAVSANLTDSGDLLITNHNTSPFSSSDKRNSYRFRFIKGDFVLQEYTHGYSGHSSGKYRTAYIFDLANHTYRKSDTERCDYEPQKPCPSAITKRLGTVPTMTLGNFAGYANADIVRDLEKYVVK